MKRNLIKQGRDTLTITLPKAWIKKYGLVAGDSVEVDQQDRTLILSVEKGVAAPRTKIYTEGLNTNTIWRVFIAAYRSGYDEIEIFFDDLKKRYPKNLFSSEAYSDEASINIVELVQGLVNRFIGMEIIDQQTKSCLVKDVMRIDESEFDNALRRIFLLLLSLSNECAIALKENKKELFSSVDITDTNIDRFTDFLLRIINKKGYKDYRKSSIIYSIVLLLEFLGDEYKRFLKLALQVDKPSQKLVVNTQELNELLRRFYELFYKPKMKEMNEFHLDLYKKMFALQKEFKEVRKEEQIAFSAFLTIVRMLIDLVQLKLDLES